MLTVTSPAWTTYHGDAFTILFPGEPKETVHPAEDDRGAYTERRLDVPGARATFLVGVSEHSDEEIALPEAFLEEHVEAPRHGLNDILHKRSVVLPGGYPGRVLVFRRQLPGMTTPLRIYSRLYLVRHRLYALVVSTLDTGGVSEDVVKRFMDSFRP
jgi:hypothetical protein